MRRTLLLLIAIATGAAVAHAQDKGGGDAPTENATGITDAQLEAARATLNQIFGPQIQAAESTSTKKDDLALAAQLLDAAKESRDTPAIEAAILQKTAELGTKDTLGYEGAAHALDRLVEIHPEGAPEYLKDLVAIRQKQYTRARFKEKAEAGAAYLDTLLLAAETYSEAGDWKSAATQYRLATTVAGRIKDPRKDDIVDAQKHAASRQILQAKIEGLKKKVMLAKDSSPAIAKAAATELLKILVVEMDDPAEARKYGFLLGDADLQKMVTNAARPVETLNADESEALGKWYKELANTASAAAQIAMLERSQGAYERFLEVHTEPDLRATAAKLTLKTIQGEIEKAALAGPADSIDWKKDRKKVVYRWLKQTMGKGSWDYSDREHKLLTDGYFRPKFHDNSVAWSREAKPAPVVFNFGRKVKAKGVRVFTHGTDAPGGGMAQPSFVRVYSGTKSKPGRLLANVQPVPDKTGWLEIPLKRSSSAISQYFWIEIGASKGKWTLVEEIEFR